MNPKQQRITIAEVRGWRYNIEGIYESWFDPAGSEWQVMHGWQTYKDGTDILPDYLNDLNAMHEMEKVLTNQQKEKYLDILSDFTEGRRDTSYVWHDTVFATAAQRAEAFLKTLNIWKV